MMIAVRWAQVVVDDFYNCLHHRSRRHHRYGLSNESRRQFLKSFGSAITLHFWQLLLTIMIKTYRDQNAVIAYSNDLEEKKS